jgi:hypothetical protein
VYWYRLYPAFEGQTRVIVGNAYQIKSIPGPGRLTFGTHNGSPNWQ